MNEKHTDNSIEQTFRRAFDQVKTKPSENFWTEASNTILERTNKLYTRRVRMWKVTSFALAATLLCVVSYAFYTTNKINSNQTQMTFLEKQVASNRIKDALHEKNAVFNAKDNANIPFTNSPGTYIILPDSSNAPDFKQTLQSNGDRNSEELSAKVNANLPAQIGINRAGAVIKDNESNKAVPPTPFTNENSATLNYLPSVGVTTRKSSFSDSMQTDFSKKDLPLSLQPGPILSKSASDTSLLTPTASAADSLNHSVVKNSNPVSNPAAKYSPFSIGLFIAPSVGGTFKEANNTYPKSGVAECDENTRMVFDAGINIDYTISNKWTLQSGLGYHTCSFSIKPTSITAQQNASGVLGYSVITSIGILQFPYYNEQIQAIDSIQARGSAYYGYLSIPLQIKYNFTTEKHFGIYLTGGIVTNFLLVKGAFVHWKDEMDMDMDDESIHDIDGLKEVQISFTAGAGLNYSLGKGFFIFGEPFLNGSVTPIDQNTPEISYPFSVGLRAGLFYKF